MNGEKSGLRNVPGRGGNHFGSEDGFLKDPKATETPGRYDARRVFRAKKTARIENANYRDEMNSAAVQEWFTGVLHLLPQAVLCYGQCVILQSETLEKLSIMNWTQLGLKFKNGVYFGNDDVEEELISRIPKHFHQAAKTYKIEKTAE